MKTFIFTLLLTLSSFAITAQAEDQAQPELNISEAEIEATLNQMKASGLISDAQLEETKNKLKNMDDAEIGRKVQQGLKDPAAVERAKKIVETLEGSKSQE